MHMGADRIWSHLIVYIGDNTIAFREIEQRKRPLSIDTNDRARSKTIWVRSHPCDVPIKCDGSSIRHGSKGGDAREQALR